MPGMQLEEPQHIGWAVVFRRPGTVAQRRVFHPEPPNACWYCKGSKWLQVTDSVYNLKLQVECSECNGTGERLTGPPAGLVRMV